MFCLLLCRARLVASTRAAGTAASQETAASSNVADAGWGVKSSFNQLEWAHELSKPETGCLLLAHPYMFRERQTYFYQVCSPFWLQQHHQETSIRRNTTSSWSFESIRSCRLIMVVVCHARPLLAVYLHPTSCPAAAITMYHHLHML